MNTELCPHCNSEIPDHAPGKLCPSCVLRDADELQSTSPSAPTLQDIGTAFPNLEIISFIGQGGMGFVYQVRQPDLDRTVALKILSPTLSTDPAFAERFAREARVLGKLQHPNIVTIFESGEGGGFLYLLMEFVDGVNLRQAMRAGRFSPEQALAIVPGICDALQAAHSEGIWHRDIKPENILLDKEGRIKIVDFGIARLVGDPQQNFTLTLAGHALGSTAYMAPEQHEKPHEVDHRADIYSLGVVIYELLTGELPLGRFPSPGQRAEVNARIDEIVLKTLEKERNLRQQSATEVKTDLQTAETQPAPPAKEVVPTEPAPSLFQNPNKLFRTSLSLLLGGLGGVFVGTFGSPLLIGLGYLSALLGLGGCGWILWIFRHHTHQSNQQPSQPSPFAQNPPNFLRTSLGLWLGGVAAVLAGSLPGGFNLLPFPAFGCVAALLGLIGCGWLLWRIRHNAHPSQDRPPLLVLVFWPIVLALALLSMQVLLTANYRFTLEARFPERPQPELEPFLSAICAISVVILPLLLAKILWLLFGRNSQSSTPSRWRITLALFLAISAIVVNHFELQRTKGYHSSYSADFQIYSNEANWPADRPLIEKAVTAISGKGNPTQPRIIGPGEWEQNEITHPFSTGKSPYIIIDWRAHSKNNAKKLTKVFREGLQSKLPKKFKVQSGSIWKTMERYPKVKASAQRIRYLRAIPLLTGFAIVLLLTSGNWTGFFLTSFASLVTAGLVARTDWPGVPSGSPPLITYRESIPEHAEYVVDYSTPKNTMKSYLSAAKHEDTGVFEVTLSTRLIDLVSRSGSNSASVMESWKHLSFYRQVSSSNEKKAHILLKDEESGNTFESHLVNWQGNWQVDTLFPIPFEEKPLAALESVVAAAKAGDSLRFLNSFSESILMTSETEKQSRLDNEYLTDAMQHLSEITDLQPIEVDDDHPIFKATKSDFAEEGKFSETVLRMEHEHGQWKVTKNHSPIQAIFDAVLQLLEMAKNGNERLFREALSKDALEQLPDYGDFANAKLISSSGIDNGRAEVILEPSDDSKQRFTVVMIEEDGQWKLSSERPQ